MRKKPRAVTLIELVALVGMLAALLSLSTASLARFRELSKRLVCSTNLKGIGAVAQIYAQDNDEQWMIPPFKRGMIDQDGIDYMMDGPTHNTPPVDPGEVGFERQFQSTSETDLYPNAGSSAVSTTRAFWMLVRSGDVYREQFICPSSYDAVSDTTDVALYYDFKDYSNISYGYQVPFGPRPTQPHAAADKRRVQAADKGPFYLPRSVNWDIGARGPINLDDPPETWRPFNSPNHGGWPYGEGQNCLYPDASVCFQSIPAIGIDNDNIYTLMENRWDDIRFYNLIHGEVPFYYPTPPYPGQEAFGTGPGRFSSTDSLIYP